MKKLFLFAVLLAAFQSGFSQTEQFKKGQKDFQVGFGFINSLNLALEDAGVGNTASFKFAFPPPTLSLDYGVTDEISVGGYASYSDLKYALSGDEVSERDRVLFVGARGLYHIDLLPQLDTYGGLGLAYGSLRSTVPGVFVGDPETTTTSGDIYYQAIVGGRYRLAKTVGAFLEIGYGYTVVNLGLNLKF